MTYYSENLLACMASGQVSAAEANAHAVAGELTVAKRDGDAALDKAIYEIDAVMNGGVETGVEVPAFMAERMVEMRAILRKLIACGGH